MKKVEIVTTIVNGKIKRNKNTVIKAFKAFEGKTITLIIKPFRKTRSNSQNAYHWAVIVPLWQNILQEEWGEFPTKNEVHEFLKYNCNYEEKVVEETGEIIRMSKSTVKNTTVDQEEFHEKARRLALEMFNVEIPLPNEQITIET